MAGPYTYEITVNYNRETVTEHKEKEVELPLSVEKLHSIVGDNEFWFGTFDEGLHGLTHWLTWNETRDETDEEMQARIAEGENYNRQREKWIAERNAKSERKQNGNTDKN